MSSSNGPSLGFELLDIEIIDHKKEPVMSNAKWNCDECSLFFLSKEKLAEHKNKHLAALPVSKCQYCNKTLSPKKDKKESSAIRKCNTCEYKCTKCPLRFQRYSSLVNHEKTHLQTKKKHGILKRKSDVIKSGAEKVANIKVTKKRHSEKVVLEQPKNVENIGNEDVTGSHSPRKRRKTLSTQIHVEKLLDSNDAVKTPKQSVTTVKKTPGIKIHKENKQNNVTVMSADLATTSSHDSIVNYKPFSCHVCGENFASDHSLLQHIQSHGENVSKGFKCKHCGDEFDDIYKMQYHLAICPLAEDEAPLVKNIVKLHTPPSIGLPRKKGRPRKIKSESLSESSNYNLTPSLSTRGSMKRRNTENEPNLSLENEFVDSNCDEMEHLEVDNIEEDPLGGIDLVSGNINNLPIESSESVTDDVTKVHSCPFPRCGIKFSREKALLCHMRNHSDVFEDSYKCHKCDIPFDDIHSLRTHLNECKDIKEENEDNLSEPDYTDEYSSPDKPCQSLQRKKGEFKCNVCGKMFASQDKLKRHLALHGSSNFICRICNDVFINQPLLDDHFLSKHPLKSSYHCEICNEDFISELFLSIHESEYHGESISTKPTNPTNIDRSESLKAETTFMKNVKRPNYCSYIPGSRQKNCFWCPICLECFDQKDNMRSHFRSDHIVLSDSAFTCEVCDTEKPNAEMMCYHLEMHSANLLSVNRFSTLRACVNEKGIKVNEIIQKRSKCITRFKNDSNYASGNDEHIKLTSKIKKTKSKATQNKLETEIKAQKSSINKGKPGRKGKQPIDSLLKQYDDEALASSSQVSNLSSNSTQLKRYKFSKIGDCRKLKTKTGVGRIKINTNKFVSLARRKRKVSRKNVKNFNRFGDKGQSNADCNTNSSTCDFSTKDLTDNNDSESVDLRRNLSSENNFDDMLTKENLPSSNENKTTGCPSVSCDQEQTEAPAIMLSTETKIVESDSSNETSEEICCSMCSMKFYHQDELLDHVATHI